MWIPIIVAIAFIGGWIIKGWLSESNDSSESGNKINVIMDLIEGQYVDEDVSLDSLLEYALPGIMTTLDPHSAYIPASDLKKVNDDLEGSFSGIGISFMMSKDTIMVLEVISGGPSEKVGILAGDRIVSVDGKEVASKGLSNDKVMSLLRGPENSKVKLGIKRSSSKKPLTFEVTRGQIPNRSVDAAYMLADGIGYIKVNKFAQPTYDEFITALNDLKTKGAKSFTIDLRGNGGGLMDIAILMANEFLNEGDTIISKRGRKGDRENFTYRSDGLGSFKDAQLTVLIDEYSASSSEIFAGAIQDNDRGLVIGRRSFGKGLIQKQIVLPDSSAIRLTVARYYTPSGRSIQKPYKLGQTKAYDNDIIDRYSHGEAFSADSIKQKTDEVYKTSHGRTVYGGGGIMPDIFVPNDTAGITSYYINVANAGLLQRFAFEYCDLNRDDLAKAKTVKEMLKQLPPDDIMVKSFALYAADNKIPARWYYINISKNLIVTQLKALIARDILGQGAYYEIMNDIDKGVKRSIDEIKKGNAKFPIVNKKDD